MFGVVGNVLYFLDRVFNARIMSTGLGFMDGSCGGGLHLNLLILA